MFGLVMIAVVGVIIVGLGALMAALGGVLVNRAGKGLGHEIGDRLERMEVSGLKKTKEVRKVKGDRNETIK